MTPASIAPTPDGLRADYPASAEVFEHMAQEEDEHRQSLIDMHKRRFGNHIPLIRREHVRGYYERKPDWLTRPAECRENP